MRAQKKRRIENDACNLYNCKFVPCMQGVCIGLVFMLLVVYASVCCVYSKSVVYFLSSQVLAIVCYTYTVLNFFMGGGELDLIDTTVTMLNNIKSINKYICMQSLKFSDQFQDLAEQKWYARTSLLYISNGESQDMFLLLKNGQPIGNPYFKHCVCTWVYSIQWDFVYLDPRILSEPNSEPNKLLEDTWLFLLNFLQKIMMLDSKMLSLLQPTGTRCQIDYALVLTERSIGSSFF